MFLRCTHISIIDFINANICCGILRNPLMAHCVEAWRIPMDAYRGINGEYPLCHRAQSADCVSQIQWWMFAVAHRAMDWRICAFYSAPRSRIIEYCEFKVDV